MIRSFATTATMTASAALFSCCAAAQPVMTPAVPENLRPAAGLVLSLETLATGVQIYECSANKADPARFEWALTAPEADLFDRAGNRIGRHYGGPTWEVGDQGKVVGEVAARDDGPDPAAIPWLLLKAKSASGSGAFARTQSVQRLRTVGGKAPAQGCSRDQAGAVARVPYQATYLFYGPQS